MIPYLFGLDRAVVSTIAEFPALSDFEIGRKLGITARLVSSIRLENNIPNAISSDLRDEPELFKRRCANDDKLLDQGVCRVNLFGEERARYLEMLENKQP